jgi:hypothetical protein
MKVPQKEAKPVTTTMEKMKEKLNSKPRNDTIHFKVRYQGSG